MIFEETRLPGSYLIRLEKRRDDRGFFARSWCRREFEAQGLETKVAQASISVSREKGTLRGLHYQVPPAAEVKIVRCARGAIYDVILDLRQDSPAYGQWLGTELAADNYAMLYVPDGFAHGFQTLTDDVEVFYQMSRFHSPQHQRGVRYNDPLFGIEWPAEIEVISDRDRNWPDYQADAALRAGRGVP